MFEAFLMIMTRLVDCGDASFDLEMYEADERDYEVTLNDFEGFDEDWEEIMREYEDPEMVEALYELLDEAEQDSDGWTCIYRFPDFSVELHYTSEDI